MSFPRALLSVVLCLFSAAPALVAQNQYVTFYSGSNSPSTDLLVYQTGTLLPTQQRRDVAPGTFLIIPTPDGTKNYLIANCGGSAVTATDGNFGNPRAIASSIAVSPQTAALSPDARRLVLAANRIYLFETSADTILNPAGLEVQGTPVDVAFSFDSSKAFVLSRSVAGASGTVISQVDLQTGVINATLGLRGENVSPATGIIMAPNGFLYVSNNNTVWEIDPRTLKVTTSNNTTGEFVVTGYPDKGFVTGDGKYLVFANKRPVQGNTSLIQMDLSNRTIQTFANFNAEVFAGFANASADAASGTNLYGWTESGRLYDIRVGSGLNVNPSILNADFQNGLAQPTFNHVAFSNENPARYAFLTSVTNGTLLLYQMEVRDRRVQQTPVPNGNYKMSFVSPAALSGGTQFLGFNGGQTITAGQQSPLPIVVRLIDNLGRGISGGRVTFSSPNAGVTFSDPTFITGSDGYAQTFVTAPSIAGQFTVVASGGTSVADLTLNFTVPGSGGGGGGTGGPSQGGIFVVSGNGQLTREQNLSAPLVVIARDPNGVPIPNVPVTYSITGGQGSLAGGTAFSTTTDANGKAEAIFLSTSVSPGLPYLQATVEAATTLGKVNFYITTYPIVTQGGQTAPEPTAQLLKPTLEAGRVINGKAGETLTEAIVAVVGPGVGGGGIPNIGMRIELENPDGPAAACEGDPLSDASGLVTCNMKMGNKIGQNYISVVVGEARRFPPIQVNITVGPPSKIVSTLGSTSLIGKAGDRFTLRTRVTDLGDNAIASVPVRWAVTRGTGTLQTTANTADSQGQAQNTITLGGVPGPVQVRASINDQVFVNFDLTVDVTVGNLAVVSGNGQSVFVNRPFDSPLVVLVTDQNNAPVSNISVGFTATGPVTLSSSTATTDANGRASINATATGTPGAVTVTATAATRTASFSLSVQPPAPTLTANGFANAASFEPGLVPCGLAVVSGANLAPGVTGTINAPSIGSLPFTLGPVESLTIGGLATPIQYVSNANGREQIGIQVPCDLPPGFQSAEIRVQGLTVTNVGGVQVLSGQPGLFEYTAANGLRYALAYRSDGSLVGPDNPAVRGETVSLVVTGLGQTNPATGTNRVGISGQAVVAELIGGINDAGVRVVKAEYRQGFVGQYLVELDIPTDTAAGPSQNVAVAIAGPGGSLTFGNGSQIPIR